MGIVTDEQSEVLKKHHQREMLKIYRKALTILSKYKLLSLGVEITANFMIARFQLTVTVFQNNGDNRTFIFYDFQTLNDIKVNLHKTLEIIKTDDFRRIKQLAGY